jgi:hypothetical protein
VSARTSTTTPWFSPKETRGLTSRDLGMQRLVHLFCSRLVPVCPGGVIFRKALEDSMT